MIKTRNPQSGWWGAPERVTRTFPPLIKDRDNRAVTIHEDWVKLALEKKYRQLIPLPLPMNAAEQNATLKIMTTETVRREASDYEALKQVKASGFARKIGLSSHHRRRRLRAALNGASAWFGDAGGELDVVLGPQGVAPQGKLFFGRRMPPQNSYKRSPKTVSNVPIASSKTVSNVPTIKSSSTEDKESIEDGATRRQRRFASSGQEKEGRKETQRGLGQPDLGQNKLDEKQDYRTPDLGVLPRCTEGGSYYWTPPELDEPADPDKPADDRKWISDPHADD